MFGLLCCALISWLPGCEESRRPVVVFHAASLSKALGQIEQGFEIKYPKLDLRLEPSGSQVAARKVAELKRRADLVLVADWRVIEDIMRPEYARFNLRFAANELVLAYGEHSPRTAEIDAKNWPKILAQKNVSLGRASEHTAPLGFQTLMLWQLEEMERGAGAVGGPDLAGRLAAHCDPAHVVPDIGELVSLLESRVIDYAFVFRSMAEEHRLKVLRLDSAINLGDPKQEAGYARARVKVNMQSGREAVTVRGAPILYGLTVPPKAPHRKDALTAARYLLGPEARRVFVQAGYRPLKPSPASPEDQVPPELSDGSEQP